MNWARGVQHLLAVFSNCHENDALLGLTALDEFSLLHPGELVRETAFVPPHTPRQVLLAHFAFAEVGKAGENSELGPGEAGCFGDVTPNAGQNIIAHKLKGVPDTKFLRREQFGGHR
jgi:hypothetical protein